MNPRLILLVLIKFMATSSIKHTKRKARLKTELEKFPTDIAVELKEFAKKHSLHCAKTGKGIEAYADKSEADRHLTSFKMKCTGVLSEITCQEIEKMLQNAGWHAVNIMKSKTKINDSIIHVFKVNALC